jgi:protein O-mannosyl-transferase
MKKQHLSLSDKAGSNQRSIIFILIILLITYIAYLPSLKNGFTNWDDPNYVYKNAAIQDLNKENVKILLTKQHMGNYHPISMLSLALDYSFSKLKPKTYHTTNLLLHLANTVLVFIFISLLLGKIEVSAICAALFGIHTLHVESVAWISERKDVMYTLFFLASLIFYVKYVNENKRSFYFFSLLLFIFSCLSKGMAVSLSLILIAIDYLKGRDLFGKKVIFEKIPFFILSFVFGIIAINAQRLGPDTEGIPDYNFFNRLIFASYGMIQYFIKLTLPLQLSAFYPYPEKGSLPLIFWISLLLSIGIISFVFYSARKNKELTFCFLFFLFNIVMVLQILPVGKAIMADRYAYVPSIGFFLLIGIAYDKISNTNPAYKRIAILFLLFYIGIIMLFTYERCKVWKDSLTLWTDAIEKFNTVGIAYNNRGVAYAELKSYKNSIDDYNQAIKLNPKNSEAYNNKGVALSYLKEYKESINNYNKAIEVRPNYPDAYYNRANAFISLEDPQRAILDYNKVIQLSPHHSGALNNRGLAKRMVNDFKGSQEDFDLVIRLFPNNAEAYGNRSLVRLDLKDYAGAEEDSRKAKELNPLLTEVSLQSGNAKSLQNDFKGAIIEYTHVIENDPNNFDAFMKRGMAKISLNDLSGGMEDISSSIKLKPYNADAYMQRGIVKNTMNNYAEAIEDYNKAIELKPDFADAFCNRGITKYNIKDMKGSISDYNKALTINPQFEVAYSNRGLLKSNLKDLNGAMIDYNKSIEINPNFALAYSNRGVLKFNMGNKKGACEDWKKGAEMNDLNSRNFLERFCK